MNVETLTILGSTGSIGAQTLQTLALLPDEWRVNFLTTNTRIDILERQAKQFSPRGVAIADESSYHKFCATTSFKGIILCGSDGICEAASDSHNTVLMSALVGFSGVLPTLAAIQAGKTRRIALANKESLVSAGCIIMREAEKKQIDILPVDSEHSAILQCLQGENQQEIEKIILTASGGPFRERAANTFNTIRLEDALRHPTWNMGAKITIDSATLMNKGFEVIEAYWLFNVLPEQIDVVIHPQSIIHSLVQFQDGSIKAQLGMPDMRVPIAYALAYPRHVKTNFSRLNFLEYNNLHFFAPDREKFPCLDHAYFCLNNGGTYSAALNAANEIAVSLFFNGKIVFSDIPKLIEKSLEQHDSIASPTISNIIDADTITRELIIGNRSNNGKIQLG